MIVDCNFSFRVACFCCCRCVAAHFVRELRKKNVHEKKTRRKRWNQFEFVFDCRCSSNAHVNYGSQCCHRNALVARPQHSRKNHVQIAIDSAVNPFHFGPLSNRVFFDLTLIRCDKTSLRWLTDVKKTRRDEMAQRREMGKWSDAITPSSIDRPTIFVCFSQLVFVVPNETQIEFWMSATDECARVFDEFPRDS